MQTLASFTKDSLEAMIGAIRDGVELIVAKPGAMPKELPPRAIVLIDDSDNLGPAAWDCDVLLKSGVWVYLSQYGVPVNGQIVVEATKEGQLALITAGPTYRFWLSYLKTLGVIPNSFAHALGDPTKRTLQ